MLLPRHFALIRFTRSLLLSASAAFTAAAITAAPVVSQTTADVPDKGPVPLLTRLTAPLYLNQVQLHTTVFARVEVPWSMPGCTLAAGSRVMGHVMAITPHSKTDKTSMLKLVFGKADCTDHPEATPHFTLFAIIGADPNDPSAKGEGTPVANGLPLQVPAIGRGRSILKEADLAGNIMRPAPRKLPTQLNRSDVIALPKVQLKANSENSGVAEVTATGTDVALEAGTMLVLLPQPFDVSLEDEDFAASVETGAAAERNSAVHTGLPAIPALKSRPEGPDVTASCTGACTKFGKGNGAALADSKAVGTIPLSSIGLRPFNNYEAARLNQDVDVVYLDATHLLCTFDPHALRWRGEAAGDPSRLIRTVVIDTSTYKIEQVFDWRVRGAGQYLWKLSSGHLLVHLGRDLQEISPDLKLVKRFSLGGRLAWVVPSPSGNYIAIGTVVERYSAAVRQQMVESVSEEPEEEVRVHIFDADRHEILSGVRPLHLHPPVLSDTGELSVQREGPDHWNITERDWRNQEHFVASTHSSCRPDLSTPGPQLLFLTGCNSLGSRWYRLLRMDGHPVLTADSESTEFAQRAEVPTAGLVAIRSIEELHAHDPGELFRPSDLKAERIALYSTANGSRLQSFDVSDFAPADQGFAISPAGDQIVLMGRSGLQFYTVTHSTP